jgi:hypothetical protein
MQKMLVFAIMRMTSMFLPQRLIFPLGGYLLENLVFAGAIYQYVNPYNGHVWV